MNPSASDLSLYQFLEGIEPDLSPLTVSLPTLQATVTALINLLIERKIAGNVWLKFPNAPWWKAEIDRYLQRGRAAKVYLCANRAEGAFVPSVASSALIPVSLETNAHLQRECFAIVLATGFSCLLLAKEQTSSSGKGTNWQLLYGFEVSLINRVLKRIQQSITITDTTPEEVLSVSAVVSSSPVAIDVMQALLLQQIQQTESGQQQVKHSERSRETIDTLTESLAYSHEVLQNLIQELKLPLTNIKTALRLLDSMQSKREQRQRYIDLLQRECDRQSLLLTGLQEFIQFTQSLPTPVDCYLKLEDLIPGIVSTYQPLAEERGILLGYTIPPGFPAVACPESWLRQILLNLLSNSLKFTPSGRVQVQANLKPEAVEITVSDTGIGIDPAEIPLIFRSFYKGRNAISHASNSAGLGLTIVQYLITRCGGAIAVTSKLNKGTTFKLTIPLIAIEG
jgi:two-component system phosphate regulon sensor histidine kinase PhoR